MRLAAQAKMGFYPAHAKAIELLSKHLAFRPPSREKKSDRCYVLDPCCGKGAAIHQLAQLAQLEEDTVYTVELCPERFEAAKALMPKHQFLEAPASFLGSQITGFSFGFIYCNPPFDDELGGGKREELRFLTECVRLLVPKGIIAFVLPVGILKRRELIDAFDRHFEDTRVYKFPDGQDEHGHLYRPFNEVCVIAKKRGTDLPNDDLWEHGLLRRFGFTYDLNLHQLPPLGSVQPVTYNRGTPSYEREEEIRVWECPHSFKPHTFKKVRMTDEEMEQAVLESPLNRLLQEVKPRSRPRPPLPLSRGHLGLVLASGDLDGVLEGPHGCHVVRGSSEKETYHDLGASESWVNPDTGAVTTKEVFPERLVTIIRVVEQDGVIKTMTNGSTKEEKDAASEANDEED